jgi:methylenetetrahydrofolate--tRNA-(uracil-5-)-methyltransferase
MSAVITIVGGGLAGSEAAWQAAERGVEVILYEMRPRKMTPAHVSDRLAELVCSNSLGSDLPDRASDLPDRAAGLLKAELRYLRSLVLACADETRVPAGGALAVDRELFAAEVTRRIEAHPRIRLVREEVTAISEGTTRWPPLYLPIRLTCRSRFEPPATGAGMPITSTAQ